MRLMAWLTYSESGFQQAGRYLLGLRLAMAAAQLLAVAVAESMVSLAQGGEALWLTLIYAALAVVGWLWFERWPPASALVVAAGLALDLLMIGGWLFLIGGYTNPLTSLMLLPIAVAIVLLPLAQSIGLTLLGIALYTVLARWYLPVTMDHHHGSSMAQLHLFGMWLTFVLTSAILLLVVGTLAQRLRRQQAQLSRIREGRLRDEQVIALGLSAAAVAHRLNTPLNTLSLLVDDLRAGETRPGQQEDLALMAQQLDLCSGHLRQLTSAARQASAAELEVISVAAWIRRLRESATLLWPGATIEWQASLPASAIAVDATLDQAVLNLLANALTASPGWVGIAVRDVAGRLELVVQDHGDGLETTLQGAPGARVVDSDTGLGVGLFLSNATIQRLGGTLKARVEPGGTTMIIELPLAEQGADNG